MSTAGAEKISSPSSIIGTSSQDSNIRPTVYEEGVPEFDVPPNVIDDALTRATWAFEAMGPVVALAYRAGLQDMMNSRTWRSEMAADMLLKILRGALIVQQLNRKED